VIPSVLLSFAFRSIIKSNRTVNKQANTAFLTNSFDGTNEGFEPGLKPLYVFINKLECLSHETKDLNKSLSQLTL